MFTGISGSNTVLMAAMMPGPNSASRTGSLTIPAVRISDGAGADAAGSGWTTGRCLTTGYSLEMHNARCTMQAKRQDGRTLNHERLVHCASCIVHCKDHSVDTLVSPLVTAARSVCQESVAH